ncbi:MAG TPA: sugar-binding transcriptional regulator [Aggregatilinea sp.]|jgi:DNA-binding transcriptional regulator LsrR (DeoR family)|uniref:sugar-binding transcriptional regulator n=1 Tax=Aggregatilinea sp. TaxID=2806333 RepID=UPI002B550855|nr:sugar-binding transcriptional regulator [Aggregatilinea sp.]HML21941.1 sugar-binding transcriptional regulator [Aggregatilinea sp.]
MARKPNPVDLRLLGKVSKLYYEQNLTQQEISERLRLSRPKVSRLIQQAHKEGIVQITVVSPPGSYTDLEQQLEEKYGLQEVVVIDTDGSAPQDAVSRQIGIAAADYLQQTIQDGDVIGVFWGVTLNNMVSALQRCDACNVHVVQMVGGLGPPEAEEHATGLCRRMAQLLNGKLTLLPAPGLVDNAQVKEVLLSDSYVRNAFQMFSRITVAFLGIGAASPTSWIMRNDVLSTAELNDLRAAGAVGETALRFFDAQGQPVETPLNDRILGITLDELKQIDRVVGMVGGPEKVDVVRAAMRGHLIDVLITDHLSAQALLV